MALQTTYSDARANLGKLLDQVESDCETLIIKRPGRNDMAVVTADELRGLRETAYLLRSPNNRARLLRSLTRARSRQGKAQTMEALKREVGLGDEG